MEEVLSIINSLENKNSSGYDDISNKLLKSIKEEVCTPLTVIINQSLLNGIFPVALKEPYLRRAKRTVSTIIDLSHFYLQYIKITLIKTIYWKNNNMVLGLNILQSWQQ